MSTRTAAFTFRTKPLGRTNFAIQPIGLLHGVTGDPMLAEIRRSRLKAGLVQRIKNGQGSMSWFSIGAA